MKRDSTLVHHITVFIFDIYPKRRRNSQSDKNIDTWAYTVHFSIYYAGMHVTRYGKYTQDDDNDHHHRHDAQW